MPRIARLDTPGLLHHVMIRGIERPKISWRDQDRGKFVSFGDILLPTAAAFYGTMRNHSHSMVLGGLEEISYTTRLTPLTSLMIRLEMRARIS